MAAACLALVCSVLACSVLFASPSWAHAKEVASDPANKSQVSAVPATVSLMFNEEMIQLGSQIRVTGPAGVVNAGKAVVDGRVATQRLSTTAPAGKYTVRWKVTSADGHPVSGSFTFTARAAAGAPPVSPSPAEAVSPTPEPAVTATAVTPTAVTSSVTLTQDDTAESSGLSGAGIATIAGIGAAILVVLGAGAAVVRSRRSRS